MKKKVILSIVIPVYNVEKYINRCLQSVLAIDYSKDEYEIIIVNDGTPDNSMSIVGKVASEFSNMKIIEQENRGLGGARNTGLRNAVGEYIYFLDSDDFIIADKFVFFFRKVIEFHPDVAIGNFYNYFDSDNIQPTQYKLGTTDLISESGFTFFLKYYRKYINTMVWRSIYRREYLLDKKLFFSEGVYFEDVNWTPKVLLNADRVVYAPITFYNYVQRSGSIVNSIYSKKKLKDLLYVNRELLLLSTNYNINVQRELGYIVVVSTFVSLGYFQRNGYIDSWTQRQINEVLFSHCSHYSIIKILLCIYSILPKVSNYVLVKYYGK